MRRGLSGYPTSDITRYFPYLLKDVLNECNGNYSNIVDIFKKNLINRNKGKNQEMPDNKKLRERIINANMYNAISYLRIFFRKLESDKNPAPVDFNKLNIEHIMPQTPTKEWYDALGVDKETYEENLNSKSSNGKKENSNSNSGRFKKDPRADEIIKDIKQGMNCATFMCKYNMCKKTYYNYKNEIFKK